ncbi:hypothetical protein HHK36_008213 [Tetracentron sinense]|uniref:Uncharacterized protein n=1 Tax=Tetracentron sinense TaxID=13715 RepID=A0A834ZJ47_TETSI|nr:hypothetical protein HHK36_008213 [Tetracentron sinense]
MDVDLRLKSAIEDQMELLTMMMQMENLPEFFEPYTNVAELPSMEFTDGIVVTPPIFDTPHVASPTLIKSPSSISFMGTTVKELVTLSLLSNVVTGRLRNARELSSASTFSSLSQKRNTMGSITHEGSKIESSSLLPGVDSTWHPSSSSSLILLFILSSQSRINSSSILCGFALKKQMLDDRRFSKMNLNMQRLLQVIAHGEQVFPRVKEKCATKSWFTSEDIVSLEELIGRLRRLKENVGFIANRVTAIQAGLDSWQAEQINKKLYYLSFLSIIFLPLSIITGVFGMNVGGVPWTGQKNPAIKDGFRNVLFVCFAMLLLVLLCFAFPALYVRIAAWRRQRTLRRSWSLNRKSFLRRTIGGGGVQGRGDYLHF